MLRNIIRGGACHLEQSIHTNISTDMQYHVNLTMLNLNPGENFKVKLSQQTSFITTG